MTLILSYANPSFALQVSDRRITREGTKRELDGEANKSILLRTRNAVVCLGYSGLAVVAERGNAERVTDHWLIEQLVGHEVGPALNLGGSGYNFDLGYALKSLCEALDASRFFRGKRHIEISFCGFQWKARKMSLHLTGSIEHTGRRSVASQRVARTRDEHLSFNLVTIPETSLVDDKRLLDELCELGPDPDKAEALLVETIVRAAKASPVIGADCLSVLMQNRSAKIRVRYHGERLPVGPAGTPGTPTPWIVTPRAIAAPTITVSSGMTIGGTEVEIDAPPLAPESFVLRRSINPTTGREVTTYIVGATQMLRRPWGPTEDVAPPPIDGDPDAD